MQDICPVVRFVDTFYFNDRYRQKWRICYAHSIFLIEKGEGSIVIEDISYALFPGVLLYIPAGIKHKWLPKLSLEPLSFQCAYFDWYYQDRSMLHHRRRYFCYTDDPFNSHYVNKAISIHIPEYQIVEPMNLWQQMFEDFTSQPEVLDSFQLIDSLKIQGKFQLFLNHLIRHVTKSDDFMDQRILKILKRIEEASVASSVVKIEVMAEDIGLSRTHFHHLFKKETGVSPKKYLMQYRINQAKKDLSNTNHSVTDIAALHQFNSVHDFTKVFRKITGVTPTEYRKRNQSI